MSIIDQTPIQNIQIKPSTQFKENQPVSQLQKKEINSASDNYRPQNVNIFSQGNSNVKPINIFNKRQQYGEKINIFGNGSKSVNLFNLSNAPQSVNIFKSNSKPLIASTQEDQESNASNGSQNSKIQRQFKVEPQVKVMKFQYKQTTQKLKSYPLKIFRINFNSCQQNSYVTLEKPLDKADVICLVVRSKDTKFTVFQGTILNNFSKAQHFAKRDQNVKINLVVNKKESEITDENKTPYKIQEIKMQFETVEDAKDFMNVFQNLFTKLEAAQQKEGTI